MWAFRLFRAPSVCALVSLSDGRIGFSEVTGLPSNSSSEQDSENEDSNAKGNSENEHDGEPSEDDEGSDDKDGDSVPDHEEEDSELIANSSKKDPGFNGRKEIDDSYYC